MTRLLYVLLLIVSMAAPAAADDKEAAKESEKMKTDIGRLVKQKIGPVELASDIAYLALLAGKKTFLLSDIQAEVIIIEVFDFYCPYCQKAAPDINALFELIKEKGLDARIKMIGIGTGNTSYEAKKFREKYSVPFPMVPDRNKRIVMHFNHKGTPYFITLKKNQEGRLEECHRSAGAFWDAEDFLNEVMKAAGIAEQAPAVEKPQVGGAS
jgi:peroxiredoxin